MPRKSRRNGTVATRETDETSPETSSQNACKYDPSMDDIAYEVTRSGGTLPKVAAVLGVTPRTLENWRTRYESFFIAIKKGRREHDAGPVENSLLKRAIGYDYTETSVESIVIFKDGQEHLFTEGKRTNGSVELVPGIRRRVTTKHVPPDVGALCFWLCNRQPEDWKNVQRQIVEGEVKHQHTHTLDLSKYGRSELEQLRVLVGKGTRADADAKGRGRGLSAGEGQPVPLRPLLMAGDRA